MYTTHQINDFEFSIRDDGGVFYNENGSGLKKISEDATLINGTGFSSAYYDPEQNFFSVSHLDPLSNQSGFTSGIREYDHLTSTSDFLSDVYIVTAEEIRSHIADYNDNGQIDFPIPSIYNWPAIWIEEDYSNYGGIPKPFSPPFYDLNRNDIYEPQLGEFPNIKSVLPDIFPSKIILKFFTAEHLAVNGYVMLYGFDCLDGSMSDLKDAIVVEYKIHYTRNAVYKENHIGIHSHYNLGNSSNDFLAFDTTTQVAFSYNDPQQIESSENANIVVSQLLRRYPLETTDEIPDLRYYSHFDMDDMVQTSGPLLGIELYEGILQGRWNDGSARIKGGYGYDPSSTDLAHFSFDGNLDVMNGWTEIDANNTSGNRSAMFVFDPIPEEDLSQQYIIKQMLIHASETGDGLPDYELGQRLRNGFNSLYTSILKDYCREQLPKRWATGDTENWSLASNLTLGKVHILNLQNPSRIRVWDILGRVVIDQTTSSCFPTFNLYSTGVYFVLVESGDLKKKFKLVNY